MKKLTPEPYWDETELPSFGALTSSIDADVVVVGAGLTGITAALLLKDAGCRVALVERGSVGGIDTGCTTAHLAAVVDTRLSSIAKRFGRDHAQAVWDAGWAAIQQIEELIDRFEIDCDFTWLPGYLHVATDIDPSKREEEAEHIRSEAALADALEFDASYVASAPLVATPAMRVEQQAKFHPRKYLRGLLKKLPGGGCRIFENSEAHATDEGVTVGRHKIRAPWVVMATHNPLQGRQGVLAASVLQTKLALYTSYVVRAKLNQPAEEALYWDTSSPYHYLRIDHVDGEAFAIAGGADHKTGQVDDPERCYADVERWLKHLAPGAEITERWSGQVIETPDGLPIIGAVDERQFVATGFAGNGMTFGTLAALMARDAITGAKNPWQQLFDTDRTIAIRGPWKYVSENVDYPYYLVRDRFAGARSRTLRSIRPSTADVVDIDGTPVAAYRDKRGRLTTLSATCTHLGCQVHWNATESAWECPCHGSRFQPTGEVMAGPAEKPLEPVDVRQLRRTATVRSKRASR